jgi:uncharacterized protein with FMN-binding domain
VAVFLVAGTVTAAAQARLTQQEALALAFPGADSIQRRTAFLSDSDLAMARARAGPDVEITQGVLTYYVGWRDGTPTGAAYFDGHRVRSLPQVLMVVVTPDARIGRLEILRFDEPPEYRAPPAWLNQLDGKSLAPELSLKGGVVNLTGATLTSQAIVRATRRVLALHEVIRPFSPGGAR